MPNSIQKHIFILLLSCLFYSCNMTGEGVIDREFLKVYFSKESHRDIAQKFANFWIKERYLGSRTQHIKITQNSKSKCYELRLILRKDFDPKEQMSFEELQLLASIQQDLNTNVFMEHKCELVICDNKFQTLKTPNPFNP